LPPVKNALSDVEPKVSMKLDEPRLPPRVNFLNLPPRPRPAPGGPPGAIIEGMFLSVRVESCVL